MLLYKHTSQIFCMQKKHLCTEACKSIRQISTCGFRRIDLRVYSRHHFYWDVSLCAQWSNVSVYSRLEFLGESVTMCHVVECILRSIQKEKKEKEKKSMYIFCAWINKTLHYSVYSRMDRNNLMEMIDFKVKKEKG
jgi:hypothetical protein